MWDRLKLFIVNFFLSIIKIIIDHIHPPIQLIPPMPRPSLDDLPDLCILAVFKNLSLLELLRTIRLVSTRWSSLTSSELNRRRSLIIYDNPHFDLSKLQLDQYGSNLIEHVKRDDGLTPWARLPHIDHRNVVYRSNLNMNNDPSFHDQFPEMIATLIDNLPKITNLTVVQQFFYAAALEKLVNMIDHWSDHLVTLKIYLKEEVCWLNRFRIPDDYDSKVKTQTVKLFESINRASSLKHLKLELFYFRNDEIPTLPPLTILSQLSSFYTGHLLKDQLNNTFLHNASGNGQLQITTDDYKLDVLLRIDREFCDKFVDVGIFDVLTIGRGDEDGEVGDFGDLNPMLRDMDSFCTRYISLTHLSVKIGNISLSKLSRSLSRLTQLVHLTLGLFDYLGTDDENLADQIIVPVLSVRLITLYLQTKCHNSTKRLYLPEIFPNLQVLSITDSNRKCSVCKVPLDDGSLFLDETDQFAPELRQCAMLAREPFRRCPSLHTIEVDGNDSLFLSLGLSRKLITIDKL